MMIPFTQFEDVKKDGYMTDKKGQHWSDTIYTFDIETTSLFNIDGKYQVFDKSISDYSQIDKKAVCYHWQFSANEKVYNGRNLGDFERILDQISNPCLTKTIWVFNLPYEFEFLIPILKKYTITNLVARETRKPISFHIQELNITFRCLFALTNMGLARACDRYVPNVKKAVGDLDYNVSRSPLTKMTEKELYYCEMDCVCCYELIKYFLKKYKHIKQIPLTQTSIMRKRYREVVPKSHYIYVRKTIPTLEEYKRLKEAFAGGITHGNALHIGDYLKDVESADISSSYPYAMLSEKYPCEKFRKIDVSTWKLYDDTNFCKIYVVEFYGIESKIYNHYISFSKCTKSKNEKIDNGRIIKADYLRMTLTNIDYEMIKRCYNIKKTVFKEIWVAKNDYLPKYFIDFILELYNDKTKLKGVAGQEDFYMNQKETLNATYGACVMDVVQSSTYFDSLKYWQSVEKNDLFIDQKLQEMTDSFSLFVYSHGVFITAYARKNLFERLLDNDNELDYDVVYYDTDSLKILNMESHKHIFDRYNKNVRIKLLKVALHYKIPFSRFEPIDKKGVKHLIGEFDCDDGHYSEFCTLGAKRYCYRDKEDNKLHITISGVNKKGVVALKDNIHNFNASLTFSYDECQKNVSCYNDNQEPFTFIDCDGNEYTCEWSAGIVIYPTTYKMSFDYGFVQYVNMLANMVIDKPNKDNVSEYKKHSRKYN